MACLLRLVLFCGPMVVWSQIGIAPQGAEDWYHIPNSPGPKGDWTPEELEMVKKYDVGVEGGDAQMLGPKGDFHSELLQEGTKPMTNYVKLKPEEWAKIQNVEIVDSTPKEFYGTKMVLTSRGYQPMSQLNFWAHWKLEDRPRRMALIIEDMIEDYRQFIGYLIPKIRALIDAFKEAGMPVFWSNWLRRPDDKIYGALDRFYGPAGVKSAENPMYVYAKEGSFPMKEVAPTDEDVAAGRMIHSAHLSKFADVTDSGKSYLREQLGQLGIDTLVMVGAWSEDCIIATAYDAVDTENLDVVVIQDGVGTGTPGHFPALDIMKTSVALMQTSEQVVKYVQDHKSDEKYILKAEVVPQLQRFSSPAVVHPVQEKLLTLPQVGLLVSFVVISTLTLTFAVQRVLVWKKKKSYITLDDGSVDNLAAEEGHAALPRNGFTVSFPREAVEA